MKNRFEQGLEYISWKRDGWARLATTRKKLLEQELIKLIKEKDIREIPRPTYRVCTWYVPSPSREWWDADTFDEALDIALSNYPIQDPTGTVIGNIEVGEKQHKEWMAQFDSNSGFRRA